MLWGLTVVVVFVAIRASSHFSGGQGGAVPARSSQAPAATEGDLRTALLGNGVSVSLVIHSSLAEYAGPPHGDLVLSKQAADIESVVVIGGEARQAGSTSNDNLPDQAAGEYDRCRITCDDDGRVYVNTDERAAVGVAQRLELTGSYGLTIV